MPLNSYLQKIFNQSVCNQKTVLDETFQTVPKGLSNKRTKLKHVEKIAATVLKFCPQQTMTMMI